MITKEFLDDICFITQHDHARVSFDLFLLINPDITKGLEKSEELKYAIRNHDCGWIEYDNAPKVDKLGKIFTFQNMEPDLQDELWMKSISSSIIPYSSLLIAEHFKSLSGSSSTRKAKNNFIDLCDKYLNKNYLEIIKSIDRKTFETKLSFLKFVDLLSLILCREKDILKDYIPSLHLIDEDIIDIKIRKFEDSIYKFPSGFLRNKQNIIEIPYKMLPAELVQTPKKLKDEFRKAKLKYRRIGLLS